ncbi:MAG: cysteine peptidase family C39 domain-containing protein [Reyranella sp.]|nr:cysteine peptidase family C39 domain-containing protein [Reyranella sp.]
MPLDSGLLAFVSLLRFLGQPADAAQLRHQFAPDGESFTVDHILRAAKRLGVKARRERTKPERLEKAALPAIALLNDGSFTLLARAAPDRVLLQPPGSGATSTVVVALAAGTAVGVGSDTLAGFENIVGGTGGDQLSGTDGVNIVSGGTGNDQLNGSGGNDELYGEAGDDVLNGGADNDILDGGNGTDMLVGGAGDDVLLGGDGNDTVIGGVGDDTLDGGEGMDTADYSAVTVGITADLEAGTATGDGSDALRHIEIVIGGSGDDTLKAGVSGNTLNGGAGNDTLTGGDGNDVLTGGAGNDALDGGAGTDTADYSAIGTAVTVNLTSGTATGDGTDTLIGIENVIGGSGNDTLTGSSAANVLSGGVGDDTLNGGSGVDAADYSASTAALHVDLTITTGQVTGEGADTLIGIERVTGGSGNDVLIGNSGTNILKGGAGDDTLTGGAGTDTLDGGAGTDAADYSAVTATTQSRRRRLMDPIPSHSCPALLTINSGSRTRTMTLSCQ